MVYDFVKDKKSVIDPNIGFLFQLMNLSKESL